jgi:selenocysteine lyase/cysteine desulfurase
MNKPNDFALIPDLIYLNHASVSPWPVCTTNAIKKFASENTMFGSKHYLKWLKTEHQLRINIARLINAPDAEDIALVKNTSEALSIVAYGIEWNAGDNIVIAQKEFPSNRIVWESLYDQGVKVKMVDIALSDSQTTPPEQALMEACDEHTRLISVSSVQYASGLRMDLESLGNFCKRKQILFCVDAIQSIGALKFDVQRIHADFVMADGHKWLMSPEGLGLFYCKGAIRDRLKLRQFGWHMVEDMGNFDTSTWTPANSARRFECGSPNMLGIHALNSSVALLLERKMECIEQQVVNNSFYIIKKLRTIPRILVMTDSHVNRISGIVSFKHKNIDSEIIYHDLMNHNVMCALRDGCIRFSPHYYITEALIDKAINLLLKTISKTISKNDQVVP